MVAHIVLFRPKPDINESDRNAMFEALRIASAEIPSIQRFHIGRRITHGGVYEKLMVEDYPYAAVIEFDDLAGLKSYLSHQQHAKLGELFYAVLDAGLVFDYEMYRPSAHIAMW